MAANAIFRALLRCYPAAFRNEYGDQMQFVFAEQLSEARRPIERAAVWLEAAFDAFTIAPKEHGHVILQDLRYALRIMAANPGFTAVAVLSLALGIGANTAIFSLWNAVLHAPLPGVHKPEELVILSNPSSSGSWTGGVRGRRSWLTYGEFEQLRDHADVFSGVMASQSSLPMLRVRFDGGDWEEARGRMVSGGFFELLGVNAAIGKLFSPTEDRTRLPHAVISHHYWQRRFGGRPDVLGKSFTLRNAAFTIIGVAPPRFIGETHGQQPDLWLPIRMQADVWPGRDRLHDKPPDKSMWLHVFGRLKPGVTPAHAEARANAIFRAGLEQFYGNGLTAENRATLLDQRIEVSPGAGGASRVRKEFSQSLNALLAAVGVLLLIACANLANLLLARGSTRKAEIAVRLSLGASRGRLMRQLITESLALAAMGGAAAIAVAYSLQGALAKMIAETDDRFRIDFGLNPQVIVFLFAATVAAALLFGMLPAWQLTGSGTALNERTRGAIGSFRQARTGRVLVCLQLALSLPLLVCAGLLARTAYNLLHADLGFAAERLLLLRVDLRETARDDARRNNLFDELRTRLERLPGVRSVSFSHLGVFSGGESATGVIVEGFTPRSEADRESARDAVGPGYFSTLRIPILLGREILETDRGASPKVCVINEAFAQRFFSGRNPIGMHITVDEEGREVYQVAGVAKNAHTKDLRGEVTPRYFRAAQQEPASAESPTFLIRANAAAAPLIAPARRAIQELNAGLPILLAATGEDEMAPLTAQDRSTARLAGVFGCVALALAGIGLYGVLAYGVSRRTGEIALRLALGARPGGVVTMILGETSWLVGAGLAMGAGLGYAASALIDSRLYGVAPRDPLTFALAMAVLLFVALAAAYLPARRASRLDPMTALRQQ